MNNQDYENAKAECWQDFCKAHPSITFKTTMRGLFKYIFDRAYALGKQEKDAEGEEVLTVPRSKVIQRYADTIKEIDGDISNSEEYFLQGRLNILRNLFGSKCLPDNVDTLEHNVDSLEPQAAEPKFTKGDMVHCKSLGFEGDYKVLEYTGGPRNCYDCIDKYGAYYRFDESDLEPYTEPTKKASSSINNSDINIDELVAKGYVLDPAKQFDSIIKDSFSKERRLNIAAMAMQALLSNSAFTNKQTTPDSIVDLAIATADMLIKKVTTKK